MSVRNDYELPRSQADASDDAHLGTDQGPFEGPEALESIVASLPVLAEYVSSIPDDQKATALAALERYYLQTALGLGYLEEPARSWVAALMAHLREQLELMSEPGWGDGRRRPCSLPPAPVAEGHLDPVVGCGLLTNLASGCQGRLGQRPEPGRSEAAPQASAYFVIYGAEIDAGRTNATPRVC